LWFHFGSTHTQIHNQNTPWFREPSKSILLKKSRLSSLIKKMGKDYVVDDPYIFYFPVVKKILGFFIKA
jgi:hypothetical protein